MSLVSTGDVRTWLQIAAGDNDPNAKIESLIKSVESFIDNYVGMKLEAQLYKTHPEFCYLDGTGAYFQYVPVYPLSNVTEIKIDADRSFGSGTELSLDDITFYKNGKIISEAGYFSRGHRNVRIEYTAGYAPVVGGTYNAAVSSYPIGEDMMQVIKEMVVKSFKEGATMIHTTAVEGEGQTIQQLLSNNSFWRKTLNVYKDYAQNLMGYAE